MKIEDAVRRILSMGGPEGNGRPQTGSAPLSERATSLLGRIYGPGAAAMGAAFDPARLARPDNPVGAAADFASGWLDVRQANHIGADKYFHCRANCDAAQRGPISEWTAERLSNAREAAQMRFGRPPEKLEDALEDQRANVWGREAARANPGKTCTGLCSGFRPPSLPPRYR